MAESAFLPLSESALLMCVGDRIDPSLSRRIATFARKLQALSIPGIVDFIPSYTSILVIYDNEITPIDCVRTVLSDIWTVASPQEISLSTPTVVIPVIYGDRYGDDLEEVASHAGMSPEEVIERHVSGRYTVGALGFSPGFAYLLGLDPTLSTPRRSRPRTRILGGSVGIGGGQTGIYSLPSPGGWNLIGRTPMRLFDPGQEQPLMLNLGDELRFERVTANETTFSPNNGIATGALLTGGEIEILAPGMQTTVQDLGRYGFGGMGFSPNGAADRASLIAANRLVGNPDNAAVIEMTLSGPAIRFHRRTTIALAGAAMDAVLNGLPLPTRRAQGVMPGDELVMRGIRGAGMRTYLAVAGGIDVPMVLGSRSTDLTAGIGGLGGRSMRAGDWLPLGAVRRRDPVGTIPRTIIDADSPLTIWWGPEANRFSDETWHTFLSSTFTVSTDSNRMGMRLDGPKIRSSESADIISAGLVTGSIQITSEGQPIVMLPGHATIGGYTRIATVIDADLDRLGQLRPGDHVRFRTAEE